MKGSVYLLMIAVVYLVGLIISGMPEYLLSVVILVSASAICRTIEAAKS